MSGPGGAAVVGQALAAAKAVVEAAEAEEQFDLYTPTAEEMAEAREELGPEAGRLSLLRHARKMKGRPKGSRNRRTEDFARYLQQFGEDPAISTIRIASSSPEALMEASMREHIKVLDSGAVIKWNAPTLTYEGALALILRASEGLMPYFHSKRPAAIDATVRGDIRIIEELVDRVTGVGRDVLEGDFVEYRNPAEGGEEEAA